MKTLYEFSQMLYEERAKRNMTQDQFARFLGIGLNTIRTYEVGDNTPNMKTVVKILDKLGYSLKIEKVG